MVSFLLFLLLPFPPLPSQPTLSVWRDFDTLCRHLLHGFFFFFFFFLTVFRHCNPVPIQYKMEHSIEQPILARKEKKRKKTTHEIYKQKSRIKRKRYMGWWISKEVVAAERNWRFEVFFISREDRKRKELSSSVDVTCE